MKLTEREDIEAPIDYVFKQISDFPAIERSAMRRGAEVQRVDDLTEYGPGMRWDTVFMLRGKQRKMRLEMVHYEPPNCMMAAASSPNITGEIVIDLVALSRKRTRMSVVVKMQAKTLTARLLLQSLKLARNNVQKRFAVRVAGYASEVEDRYKVYT